MLQIKKIIKNRKFVYTANVGASKNTGIKFHCISIYVFFSSLFCFFDKFTISNV